MNWFILLAILFPVLSILLFKEFEKRQIEVFPAIVFNYLGGILLGLALFISPQQLVEIPEQMWFYQALIIGVFFILNFYLIAKTAVFHGISIATFSNKISLVIPVIFTIVYFDEPSNWQKISGILFALFSIYLLTINGLNTKRTKFMIFPLLVFVFTGIMESILNFTQKIYFNSDNEIGYFVVSAFVVSFLIGIVVLIFNSKKVNSRSFFGGLFLSVPNTLGVYFFIKALNFSPDSTSVLPLMNISTLVLAILVGFLLYEEKLTTKNWVGFGLAVFAIFLLKPS